MRRGGVALLAALLGIAGVWAVAATAQGAYTWAGTWDTNFGPVTMDAAGDGTYPDYDGTLTGSVSGPEGRTNSGTWDQPTKSGTFVFDMTEAGWAFNGTYEDAGGGCVFPPCTWDGFCELGPCLANGPDVPEPCIEDRASCRFEIPFGFDLLSGPPSGTPERELPRRLLSATGETEGAKLLSETRASKFSDDLPSTGVLKMKTKYHQPGGGFERHRILFYIGDTGHFDRFDGGREKIATHMHVRRSNDENCPEGVTSYTTFEIRKVGATRKVVELEIRSTPNDASQRIPCLTDDENGVLHWKTGDFKSSRIDRPRLIGGGP